MPKLSKWYLLSLGGSMTRANDHIDRRISSILLPVRVTKRESQRLSSLEPPIKPIKRLSKFYSDKTQKKPDEPTPCMVDSVKEKVSRILQDFAYELRQRELKMYYANLMGKERLKDPLRYHPKCPKCGLPRCSVAKDARLNVYLTGPETMC